MTAKKQTPMLMRGCFTGRIYIVLRYTDHGDGRFTALDKCDITEHFINFVGKYLEDFDIVPAHEDNEAAS